MELLLWLGLFDNRWLFNHKISLKHFKRLWFLPFFINITLIYIIVHFFKTNDNNLCDQKFRKWLYRRLLSSLLIVLNIFVIIYKIIKTHNKETEHLVEARKALPSLHKHGEEYDFWIRRKTLLSTSGIILIIQSFYSMYLASSCFQIIGGSYLSQCSFDIQRVMKYHSFILLVTNIPVGILLACFVFIKLLGYLSAHKCPKLLILMSRYLNNAKKGFKNAKKVKKTIPLDDTTQKEIISK